MSDVVYRPIGVIRTDHLDSDRTPIQPVYARGCRGRAEVQPEYADGLQDLAGFSHLFLIYHFHQAPPVRMRVCPFLEDVERGVFATRAPGRPNPIGLSVVELTGVEGCTLYLEGVDILDGTPLLDVKPYVARFDRVDNPRNGWQDGVDEASAHRRGQRR